MAVRACGERVGIRASDEGVLDRIVQALPPIWQPASSPTVDHLFSVIAGGSGPARTRRLSVVYSDADMIARTLDLEDALRQLDVALQLHLAEASRRRLFVHAGVVGWRGRAIVIPGSSCSGKSTLVASLVRAGATYYSDEYALLDRRGRVHPYVVPIALGRRDEPGRLRRRVAPEQLGVVGRKPLPVGLVLATHYRRGSRFRPRPLGAGEAALALLAHTVRARQAPGEALDVISRAVSGAGALKGVRGDAGATARALLARLALPEASRR